MPQQVVTAARSVTDCGAVQPLWLVCKREKEHRGTTSVQAHFIKNLLYGSGLVVLVSTRTSAWIKPHPDGAVHTSAPASAARSATVCSLVYGTGCLTAAFLAPIARHAVDGFPLKRAHGRDKVTKVDMTETDVADQTRSKIKNISNK
jgi:hypothetical protein